MSETQAATAAESKQPARRWARRLAALVGGGGGDSTGPADRRIARTLAAEAIAGAEREARAAVVEVMRGRLAAAEGALTEARALQADLEEAVRRSRDLRPVVARAFRRPAAVKLAALDAALAEIDAAANEPAPARGAGDLERALHRSRGGVLQDARRALASEAERARKDAATEAATAGDPLEGFDVAYRSRLEIEERDLPTAKRRCAVLEAAVVALRDDLSAAERAGARTVAGDILAGSLRPVVPVNLCGKCSHGRAAAPGRPALVYVGRAAGPACARCTPTEHTDNGRVYVVRPHEDVSSEWAAFACPDDALAAVEFDKSIVDRHGVPLMTAPYEIVTVDSGRRVERRRAGPVETHSRTAESAAALAATERYRGSPIV